MKVIVLDFSLSLYGVNGVFRDTSSFLEKVKDEYAISIIADEDMKRIIDKLDSLGIRKYFTVIVSSREYDMRKPDHRLVNLAIALISDETGEHVDKKDCFLIGDRPDEAIKAGNKAGIKTIRLKLGAYSDIEPEHDDERAGHTVATLKDALVLLMPKMKSKKKFVRKRAVKIPMKTKQARRIS